MTKMFDLLDPATAEVFERIDPTIVQNRSYAPADASVTTAAANENLDGCESIEACNLSEALPTHGDDSLKLEHWKPAEPQYCKEIAAYYQQSKRTIQKWFIDLKEIAPWFDEQELRLSDDRYTPLAVKLLGDRYFAGSKKKWAQVLAERFVDRIKAWRLAQSSPAIRPDILPPQNEVPGMGEACESPNCDRGMVLHFGSNPALPAIPGIVPDGNDAAYLTEMQQRLQSFEQLQQQAIAQMQIQYEQAQRLNAQYHEATSLSDQLLLQEFQLKGVQLGYAALQLKQQAFKATVQSAEAGTLAVPGKPQPEPAQPQSP